MSSCTEGCSHSRHLHDISDSQTELTFTGILVYTVEKVCGAAIIAFAALKDMDLFVSFFLLGMAIGIYTHYQGKKECGHDHSLSACTSEVLTQIFNVKLPRLVALVIGVAVLIEHMDHLKTFVPVTAIYTGAWLSQRTLEYFNFSNQFYFQVG